MSFNLKPSYPGTHYSSRDLEYAPLCFPSLVYNETTWSMYNRGYFSRLFNPKGGGGGPKVPAGQEIACHFSQDCAMVTKILDFIHKHLN